MASELRVNTLKDAAGNNSVGMSYVAEGTAKAWVNFNGTGTVATRDSLNVSGLVDGGTGIFTVSFSSSFANSNYAAVGNGSESTSGTGELNSRDVIVRTLSTTSFNVYNYGGGYKDYILNYVATHGDLA